MTTAQNTHSHAGAWERGGNEILHVKKKDPKADTSELEATMDELVYKLYNLSDEEIKIIRGKH